MMPYQPTKIEKELLDCYEKALKSATVGFDGVATKHLQALTAVQTRVAEETRTKVLAETGAANLGALLRVADAASVLLAFADRAIREQTPLRGEAKLLAERLHSLLEAAGYTSRSPFTGHRQRPGFEFSAGDYCNREVSA